MQLDVKQMCRLFCSIIVQVLFRGSECMNDANEEPLNEVCLRATQCGLEIQRSLAHYNSADADSISLTLHIGK